MMKHQLTRRNPGGSSKTKPIALRLMPDERKDADRISKAGHLSRSALARQAYLKGLPIVVAELDMEPA